MLTQHPGTSFCGFYFYLCKYPDNWPGNTLTGIFNCTTRTNGIDQSICVSNSTKSLFKIKVNCSRIVYTSGNEA